MKTKAVTFLAVAAAISFAPVLHADVRLAGVFGDHMVLQRGVPLPVWGTADAGEKITVAIGGQTASITANTNGQWRITFPALTIAQAGDLTATGKNSLTIKDVLIGDVWLCGGQSNMQYGLGREAAAVEEVPKANHPDIRLCIVGNKGTREPLADRKLNWNLCTPATARSFSAVSYYFGRDLSAAEHVPIGLICNAVSGTPAQVWTSLPTLKSDPDFSIYLKTSSIAPANDDPGAATAGAPASLFNGMVTPLGSFALKGFTWYQGESNTNDAIVYRKLFPALISDWRKQLGQGDLPFLFVQLPGNGRRTEEPAPSRWSLVREAQTMALSVPHTGMAVTIDLSLPRTILHPPNKREVGRRLALVARSVAYGEKVDSIGPMFDAVTFDEGKARVTFKNTGAGLVAGSPAPRDPAQPTGPDLPLKGFTIAGADGKFVRADAMFDGNAIIVSSTAISAPVAVRYAWADNPEVNLYNKEGFPATPFRTDTWAQ